MGKEHKELIEELKHKFPHSSLLEIFEIIDRKDFLPGLNQLDAYEDRPISIGHFQNSLSPSTVITLCEKLNLAQGQDILEIGTGSGYLTAHVYKKINPGKIITIERNKKLCGLAKLNLRKKFPKAIEEKNIRIFWENGLLAWEKFPEASFDRIYLTGIVDKHTFHLNEFCQLLKENGILLFPSDDKKIHIYTVSQKKKPFFIEEIDFNDMIFDHLKNGKE